MYSALIDGYCKEGSALAKTQMDWQEKLMELYGAYENV